MLAVSKTRIPRSSARSTMRSLSLAVVRLPKFMAPSAMAGGFPALLLGMGVVVMALLLLPRLARGHTPGLSLADFDVQGGGRVHARLTFATAEAFGDAPLDRDHDGVVTDEEVAAARDDLGA